MSKKSRHKFSDETLAKKSLKDIDCFETLINRYEEKLKNYILRISNFSYEETEEILQEVFIKAWKNLREFDQSLKFSSWIYRIAHNQTISSFRKHESRGHNKKISLDNALFDIVSEELDIPEKLDRKKRSQLVRETIKSLSKPYREVLVLKYLEDKSYEEISDILKKPTGTVATRLNRAKEAFKKSYTEL